MNTVPFNVSLGSHCDDHGHRKLQARADGHVGKPSWLHSRQMRGDHVIYLPTIPANDALPVCWSDLVAASCSMHVYQLEFGYFFILSLLIRRGRRDSRILVNGIRLGDQ